mmetsp:Transcript_9819/g.15095  ORF Transcript_9819/g.15095 Transcript_9819/m.15095 type:complete len:447 (+) Transcript_9819:98-1438(+)
MMISKVAQRMPWRWASRRSQPFCWSSRTIHVHSKYSEFSVPANLQQQPSLLLTKNTRCCPRSLFASRSHSTGPPKPFVELHGYDLSHPECNVTQNIASRVGIDLHRQPQHPLNTIKNIIEEYWKSKSPNFQTFDDFVPVVPTQNNFDSLLIPPDHVSRSISDTYYLTKDTVLRTHTSAHQTTLLQEGYNEFLVTGDVYRRDEIDSSHYPVFHQMEGVKMFTEQELTNAGAMTVEDQRALVEQDLKHGLEGMARTLFGDVEMRWVDEYFPFTDPSFELEIYYNDEWMEVLGCGVVHRDIVKATGRGTQPGWAFGLGLERLAMVLFSIPDIRLFWSTDDRFHKQFESGDIVTFQPYSKYPPCTKDISFWTTDTFHENDLSEVVRDVAGDLVENMELIDTFVHPKTNRTSNCFRIIYRSMDRSLTNEEIDALQEQVRDLAVEKLGVELR